MGENNKVFNKGNDFIFVFHALNGEHGTADAVFHRRVHGNSCEATFQESGTRSEIARILWKWRHNFGAIRTVNMYW